MRPVILGFRILLAGVCLLGMTGTGALAAEPAPKAPVGVTFTVNTTNDTADADTGNPACSDLSGKCSLRAAILQANYTAGADIIVVPAGIFTLSRAGEDDNAVLGDLDITDNLTIQGAGSTLTIIDGNGVGTGDRVFQVLPGAKNTTFSGLTIRHGAKVTNTFDSGGGIYWEGSGGSLTLNDVLVEGNQAHYSGGISLNYSALGDVVSLNHVTLHANKATSGAGGGMGVDFGDLAQFTLRNSVVYSNTAYEGGGLYFQGAPAAPVLTATIQDTSIYLNLSSLSAGIENHSGTDLAPVSLLRDHLTANHALFYGGAIGNYGVMALTKTQIDNNQADARGGGVYDYEGGSLNFNQSTVSSNTSVLGGGIFSELFIHNAARLVLTNSTLSSNTAAHDGGGLYAQGGAVEVYNTTIAANRVRVPDGVTYAGTGGGIFVSSPATFAARNMLLGYNSHAYPPLAPVPDDCSGSLNSLGYNLIETLNCTLTGSSTGNITGVDPLLGPLRLTGVLLMAHALQSNSPAIDAGEQPGCLDKSGAAVLQDERGFRRPLGAHCDIGAIEFTPFRNYAPRLDK